MKKIAVTMGDPGGIGPEVALKALCSNEIRKLCTPFIIGDEGVLKKAASLIKRPIKLKPIESPDDAKGRAGVIEFIDIGRHRGFIKGKPSKEGGRASFACIKKAVELALEKEIDAIVTSPISKESLKMAGLPWPGHTEMLAELTGAKDYAMMFVGGPLRVILVTIHTSLENVPELITKEKVFKTILLAEKGMRMLGIKNPKIGVSGLNPHAGEGGLFGVEEIREIAPSIKKAKKMGLNVSGPYPPDVIFRKAYSGELDIVVAMHHDQGLIPLKMIAFDEGVNITVGLPVIRTSPDHGTAFDIAWKAKASPESMIEAIKIAEALRLQA
jgi:4-hydroxythreonine-4-phosphate dehydrogenase